MRHIKFSLLCGAAVLASSGAMAADLPVKAKAVEYVKICSLYGAGFYYLPGTDTCIKFERLSSFRRDRPRQHAGQSCHQRLARRQ